jgi:hypothetical protein
MLENFRGLRKFARNCNYQKHKILSRQARQVRKGPATDTPHQFDFLTWRSLRALRETFLFLGCGYAALGLCGEFFFTGTLRRNQIN